MGERLEELDARVPGLLHWHKQARDALLCTYGASLVIIGNMFVIAVAATTGSAWLATVVLIVFLAGVGVLFVGLLLILLEVCTSHQAVHYDVRRVAALAYERAGAEPPVATAEGQH